MGREETLWTTVGGLEVHARAARPARGAPPIVLVHGLGVSSRYFVPTMRALAADFAVYAPDLPGSGRSARPPRVLDVAGLAVALESWLDAVGLERVSFLGNSMGCQVLVELALRAPARIERLVLVGPTVDPRWRTPWRQLPRWAREALREPASLLPLLIRDYLRFGPLRFWRTARLALADLVEEKLPRVAAPALVVRGARDAFVSRAWAERIARLLPRGRFVEVQRAAHAVNYSAPSELAALVRSFVANPAPRARSGAAAPRRAAPPAIRSA